VVQCIQGVYRAEVNIDKKQGQASDVTITRRSTHVALHVKFGLCEEEVNISEEGG
jgi:hypothetical protein